MRKPKTGVGGGVLRHIVCRVVLGLLVASCYVSPFWPKAVDDWPPEAHAAIDAVGIAAANVHAFGWFVLVPPAMLAAQLILFTVALYSDASATKRDEVKSTLDVAYSFALELAIVGCIVPQAMEVSRYGDYGTISTRVVPNFGGILGVACPIILLALAFLPRVASFDAVRAYAAGGVAFAVAIREAVVAFTSPLHGFYSGRSDDDGTLILASHGTFFAIVSGVVLAYVYVRLASAQRSETQA